MKEIKEEDWILFRRLLPGWQEAYMAKLNRKYLDILTSEGLSSDKFWALEKRIRKDVHSPGVMIEMRRSTMRMDILSLLSNHVINFSALTPFSEELKEEIAYMAGYSGNNEKRK